MKLLLPYAHDINGNLVHIDDAQKGQKYTCPNCGAELLLKISKIPEGQKYHRRNHFAHKGNSDNHCSESFLHKLFKEKCAEYIRKKISAQEDLFFEWECEKCYEDHKGNLLKKAVGVVTEYDLGVCKPDIALLDEAGKVVIVVEVVVAHKPEPGTLQYYDDNKIACLQINVEDFPDCKNIAHKLSHPDKVNLCPNPICEKCGNRMNTAKLIKTITRCSYCKEETEIALIATSNCAFFINPYEFTNEEVATAFNLGVELAKKYSKKHDTEYFVNKCNNCNEIVGEIYADENLRKSCLTEAGIGYKCKYCIEKQHSLKTRGYYYSPIQNGAITAEPDRCPCCFGFMVLRNSKYGQFWGCENYPKCNHTENKRILE